MRIFIVICLALLLCVSIVSCSSSSSLAQQTVEGYLDNSKSGIGTWDYADEDCPEFPNVYNYKFVNVVADSTEDDIRVFDESTYKHFTMYHPNLKDYLQRQKELYAKDFSVKVLLDTDTELHVKVGTLKEYVLLYDVTHLVLGQKVYSQMYFHVKESNSSLSKTGFMVTVWKTKS